MRRNPTKRIEKYRISPPGMESCKDDGANGAFQIPHPSGTLLRVIASDGSFWKESGLDGEPWEHVSVSLGARCPTWDEMDFVKRIFWGDHETVMQLHVPRTEHVNYHEHCLHMWKPVVTPIPLPPSITVGQKT